MGYCKPGGVILGSRKIDSPHEKPGWGEKRERERKKGIGRDGASFRSPGANEPTSTTALTARAQASRFEPGQPELSGRAATTRLAKYN